MPTPIFGLRCVQKESVRFWQPPSIFAKKSCQKIVIFTPKECPRIPEFFLIISEQNFGIFMG